MLHSTSLFNIFVLFLVNFSTSRTTSVGAYKCPPPAAIQPVNCTIQGSTQKTVHLWFGPAIKSQAEIDRAFIELRKVNKLKDKETLEVRDTVFEDLNKSLTKINLQSVPNIAFYFLSFVKSLPELVISSEVSVTHLSLQGIPQVGDRELDKLFDKLSNNSSLWHLYIKQCGLTRVPPTLGQKLPMLGVLTLDDNKIHKLDKSPFQHFQSLQYVTMQRNNLSEIGDDALVFTKGPNGFLYLDLRHNSLNDSGWSEKSGYDRNCDNCRIYLYDNKFETLSESKWKRFLEKSDNNRLYLRKNPIVCDRRVKWLKNRREQMEWQVKDANCVNDPGKTIFTSNLV